MAPIKLYWFIGSPPSRAAYLLANILDIGIEVNIIFESTERANILTFIKFRLKLLISWLENI